MSYSAKKLKDIAKIRTGKLDSNAAISGGIYPFFTCDHQTLAINTWAYNTGMSSKVCKLFCFKLNFHTFALRVGT